MREHRLVGPHGQKLLLELIVVIANPSESRRSDAAPDFGAHSAHRNLHHLPFGQPELLADLVFVATEGIKKANPFDVTGGQLSDPAGCRGVVERPSLQEMAERPRETA